VLEKTIGKLLEQKLQEEGFKDCYIIDIVHHQGNTLQVFIDSDKGIGFDTCRKISRYLEEKIETNRLFGEKYVLEVSSPGVERPLVLLRQYPKHAGRNIDLYLKDGSVETGKMQKVQDRTIFIEKKVNKSAKELIEVPFENIEKSYIKISFK
jgi:ribosome maturation factor RimP